MTDSRSGSGATFTRSSSAVVERALGLARRLGVEIERSANRGWHPDRLRRLYGWPATVIDVGAATGTPDLYAAFPDAYYVLIEPVDELADIAQRHLADQLDGELHRCAVGRGAGEITLLVNRRNLLQSSSSRIRLGDVDQSDVEERTVPMLTLGQLAHGAGWLEPILLKLDVEGAELDVLEGAGRLLDRVDVMFVETAIDQRYEGGYRFNDLHSFMCDHGFVLRDVLHVNRPKQAAATFMDTVYVRPEAAS